VSAFLLEVSEERIGVKNAFFLHASVPSASHPGGPW
jgi:hypothetical protein